MPSRRANHARVLLAPCAAALALVLAGCGREPAAPAAERSAQGAADAANANVDADAVAAPSIGTLEAVALELGTALDADGRVSASTERVRPGDTVYVSLVTVGEAEAVMLAVRWRDATGAEIFADERAISAAGPAVHTFSHKPATPWATGRFDVEVMLGGESAGVRSFEVR